MKILLILLTILLSINLNAQEIQFKANQLVIDGDTTEIDKIYLFKINLSDKLFLETYMDVSNLLYSKKSRIYKEHVENGVVYFETPDFKYQFYIFREHGELILEEDSGLKWIGKYNIDFSLMLR